MTIPNNDHISTEQAEQLHHTTICTDVPVIFTAWNNQSVAAKLLYIEMKQLAYPNKVQVIITIELDPTNFTAALQQTMFHTIPNCFIAKTAFVSASPITVTLLLQPGIATTLLQTDKDAETVLAALLAEQLPSNNTYPLHNESYWFLLKATQAIELPDTLQTTGKLQHHVKTNWLTTLYDGATNKQQPASNSSALLAQITKYLETEKLNYEWFNDDMIRISFTQAQQQWLLLLYVDQANYTIETYSIFPHPIPLADQPTCALLLLQLQQQLESGSFELDGANGDGELRFRLTLGCPNNIVEQTAFQTLLGSQMQVMRFLLSYIEVKE